MKVALILCLVLASAFALPRVLDEESYVALFKNFATTHNKSYADNFEFLHRFNIFKDNVDLITSENAKGNSWTLGINEWTDLTLEEFHATHLTMGPIPQRTGWAFPLSTVNVPDAVDWRTAGAVNPPKDQGQCGSCWAFSAVAAIEGQCKVETGTLYSLSESELVDCSTSYGNSGCNGGLMDNAFNYVHDKAGLATEAAYPYVAKDQTCKSVSTRVCPVKSLVDVPADDEDQLKAAVADGVVAVAIEADKSVFQFYKSGVFDNASGCGTSLDHGVAAVGYGTDAATGKKTWIVRNSWGASWGDKGYITMARHEGSAGKGHGMCGIAMMASYPKMK